MASFTWTGIDDRQLEQVARSRAVSAVRSMLADLVNAPIEAVLHAGLAEVVSRVDQLVTPGAANTVLTSDGTDVAWVSSLTGLVAVSATTFTGALVGNASTATLAATATILATARTLWGVSFDGSANVTALPTFGAGATVSSGQTLTLTGATIAGQPTWSSTQAITLSTAAQPNVTSVGTLTAINTSGILAFTTNATFTAGTGTARLHKHDDSGLVVQAVTGLTNDFNLTNNAGTSIMRVPTGATGVVFAQGLTVSAGTTAVQALTATTGVFSSTVTGAAFISTAANVATAGLLRAANNEYLRWRNAANSADIAFGLDGSNLFAFGAGISCGGALSGVTQAILDQGAADGEILTLRSSDVAHGMTSLTDTSSYGTFLKSSAAGGGLTIAGWSESTEGIVLIPNCTTEDSTRGTSAVANLNIQGRTKSVASAGAMGANVNVVSIGSNGVTRFILDSDGDGHADVSWVTY